jgi:hypothetical protein
MKDKPSTRANLESAKIALAEAQKNIKISEKCLAESRELLFASQLCVEDTRKAANGLPFPHR